ncbi:DUF1589 domain-containing protein [Rhodopirellula bahusiensis]|uniref:DUF1589 domain-containing protein n=1 Tax=Rhodopirellula bahusiensis TaxID=2014065 RepID=UPI001E4AA076|nr:DUF1589 domain-containing protein [Rhodopirellula bahusiensis]
MQAEIQHRCRPGHYLASSRCFGTKRGDQQHAFKLRTHRPFTMPGGAWPTTGDLSSEARRLRVVFRKTRPTR